MNQSVLVVEDNISLREALRDTLELAGFAVATACNGNAALASIASTTPGLIISDIQMEGMDGMTLLQKVKSQQSRDQCRASGR